MNFPTVALLDGTEMAEWMDDGGRDALVDLHRAFDVDAAALFDAGPHSPDVAALCARTADAVAAGRRLPPVPHPVGEMAFDLMLARVARSSLQALIGDGQIVGFH